MAPAIGAVAGSPRRIGGILNKEAMPNVWAVPIAFILSQGIAGTKIAPAYRWAADGSWPYGAMYVKPP